MKKPIHIKKSHENVNRHNSGTTIDKLVRDNIRKNVAIDRDRILKEIQRKE
jgi:hypothetical protein